jgi:hypothetical protein
MVLSLMFLRLETAMPNPNNAKGLIPVQHLDGSPYNGKSNQYHIPAAYAVNLFMGQPLIATGASDANGVPTVQTATAAGGAFTIGPMIGIVDGGDPIVAVTRDMPLYHPASTLQYILVADDPNLIFEMQEDSVGGSIAMATAGMKNVDLIAGAGSTITGYSGWMLDSSTIATTNTLQMRLVRGVKRPTLAMAATNARWLAMINLHSFRNLTGV